MFIRTLAAALIFAVPALADPVEGLWQTA